MADGRRGRWIAVVLALLAAAFIALNAPLASTQPGRGLDGSWAYVLHAWAGRGGFGRDLIFSYGPLGFLITSVDLPDTYLWRVAFEGLLLLVVFVALTVLRSRAGDWQRRPLRNVLLLTFLGPLAITCVFAGRDLFPDGVPMLALVFGVLNLLLLTGPRHTAARVGICAVLAALALTKGTYGFIVVLVAALIFIRSVIFRRGPHTDLIALLVGILTLWVASGNALADLPHYLRATAELIVGYPSAMPRAGRGFFILRGALVLLSITLALRYAMIRGASPGDRLLIGTFVFAVGLVLAKHATERMDGHVLAPSFTAAALACAGLLLPTDLRAAKYLSAISVLLAVLALHRAFIAQDMETYDPAEVFLGARVVSHVKHKWNQLSTFSGSLPAQRQHFVSTRAAIARGIPDVPGGQTVDLYSYRQGAILAKGLNYAPRPVFQSYSAYTPWLARMNREHLRSVRAADRVFFAIEPIDGRLASVEDGLSWFELMTRYRLRGTFGMSGALYLDLARQDGAGSFELGPTVPMSLALDEWREAPVPTAWVSGRIAKSSLPLLLRAQLVRSPIYLIEMELANGRTVRRRLIDSMIPAGFLLSPLVDTTWDFLLLASGERDQAVQEKRVRRFRIICEREGECPVSAWSLDVAPVSLHTDASWTTAVVATPMERWSDLDALEQGVTSEGDARVMTVDGRRIFFAHAPTVSAVLARDLGLTGARRVKVCFGILPYAYTHGQTDGVTFDLQEESADGERVTAMSRTLLPRQNARDQGEQCEDALLSGRQLGLVFSTSTGASSAWDWSYWSAVRRVE